MQIARCIQAKGEGIISRYRASTANCAYRKQRKATGRSGEGGRGDALTNFNAHRSSLGGETDSIFPIEAIVIVPDANNNLVHQSLVVALAPRDVVSHRQRAFPDIAFLLEFVLDGTTSNAIPEKRLAL